MLSRWQRLYSRPALSCKLIQQTVARESSLARTGLPMQVGRTTSHHPLAPFALLWLVGSPAVLVLAAKAEQHSRCGVGLSGGSRVN